MDVVVTSALQTDAGRMIFARLAHANRGIRIMRMEIISTTIIIVIIEIIIAIIGTRLSDSTVATHLMGLPFCSMMTNPGRRKGGAESQQNRRVNAHYQ